MTVLVNKDAALVDFKSNQIICREDWIMAKKCPEENGQLEQDGDSLEQKKNLPDFSKEKANKHTMDEQPENGGLQNAQNCAPNYFTSILWLSCNPLF